MVDNVLASDDVQGRASRFAACLEALRYGHGNLLEDGWADGGGDEIDGRVCELVDRVIRRGNKAGDVGDGVVVDLVVVKDQDVIRVPRVEQVYDVLVDVCKDDMIAGLNKEGSNEPATDVSSPEVDRLEMGYGHMNCEAKRNSRQRLGTWFGRQRANSRMIQRDCCNGWYITSVNGDDAAIGEGDEWGV